MQRVPRPCSMRIDSRQHRRQEPRPNGNSEGGALRRAKQPRGVNALVLEQPQFLIEAANVASKAPVRPHYSMAGDDDADRVVAHDRRQAKAR